MSYDICALLKYAIGKEENYNRVSNILYEETKKKERQMEGKTIEENGNM